MKITPARIPDVLVIEPQVFIDERGWFFESFNQHAFDDAVGHPVAFVQDNHSKSAKNVLRGLHYQMAPRAQGKLVHVVQGEVFDVAVDIRPGSITYAQWVGEFLSADNKKQMWIPPGFAHGFMTMSPGAECLYKLTDYYWPEYERCIAWDDPNIGIDWPNRKFAILSEKDAAAPPMVWER